MTRNKHINKQPKIQAHDHMIHISKAGTPERYYPHISPKLG
jgi:hypothetical protein